MTIDSQSHRNYGFVIGLLAGAILGTGAALLLAPAAGVDVRRRLGRTIDDLKQQGREVRGEVTDAVIKGAHEVEQFAAAKVRAVAKQL